jgi:hypothetical protein
MSLAEVIKSLQGFRIKLIHDCDDIEMEIGKPNIVSIQVKDHDEAMMLMSAIKRIRGQP